mgnify:CR=1 FL=1
MIVLFPVFPAIIAQEKLLKDLNDAEIKKIGSSDIKGVKKDYNVALSKNKSECVFEFPFPSSVEMPVSRDLCGVPVRWGLPGIFLPHPFLSSSPWCAARKNSRSKLKATVNPMLRGQKRAEKMTDLSENANNLKIERNRLKKNSREHRNEVKNLYNKAIEEAPVVSG